MLKLTKLEKFYKEIREFEECILQITNVNRKKEFDQLLSEFKTHAKIIDDTHSTEYNGYFKPVALKDTISRMAEIRSKFYQLKKDISKSA